MSDFFMPNRSEISQQNYSGLGSLQDILSSSFSRIQQDNQSFGGSLIHNSGFLVQPEQYCCSFGLEEGVTPIQIYEFYESQIQMPFFFKSSQDIEMQYEEIGVDNLNLQVNLLQDSKEYKNPLQDNEIRNSEPSSKEFNNKIKFGKLINSQFKSEIKQVANQNMVLENKNHFNVNQTKCFYTNKITQLVQQQKQMDFEMNTLPKLSKNKSKQQRKLSNISRYQYDVSSHEIQSFQMTPDGNMDSIQKKLAKNRESARNSRARKKLYYELMEIKMKQLQDEVKRLKENNCYQTYDNQFCNKNTENFQTFLDQQQLLFDKLENCIFNNQDKFEISMILDDLRQLTNKNNQNRNDAVRQYFDSIIEVCLPIQTKYLIYSVEQNKDFFALQSDDYTEWMKETFKKTKIQQDQIIEVKRMESKLQSIRNNISDSIQKIKDQLKLIQSETTQVDQIWEQLKEFLTPIQLGACILAIRQNSFRQELQTSSLFIQLNNSQMREEDKNIQQTNQSPLPNNNQLIKKSIQ